MDDNIVMYNGSDITKGRTHKQLQKNLIKEIWEGYI